MSLLSKLTLGAVPIAAGLQRTVRESRVDLPGDFRVSDAQLMVEATSIPFQDRAPQLGQLRELKMARSAHAYVRGSTAQFYEWLESPAGTDLPPGPAVWICGDCHIGNLGPIGRCCHRDPRPRSDGDRKPRL
jgi:hypothetical protein